MYEARRRKSSHYTLDGKDLLDINKEDAPDQNAVHSLMSVLARTELSLKDQAAIKYAVAVLKAPHTISETPEVVQAVESLRIEYVSDDRERRGKVKADSFRKATNVAYAASALEALRREPPTDDLVPSFLTSADGKPFVSEDLRAAMTTALEDMRTVSWSVDSIQADGMRGKELRVVGFWVLLQVKALRVLRCDESTLKRWLEAVSSSFGENPTNTFHTATRGAEIVQMVHWFIDEGGAGAFLSENEKVALVLSAICLHSKHDGRSNEFHVRTLSDRALQFNDRSVQENHTASSVFAQTLSDDTINIFGEMPKTEMTQMRAMMLDLIVGSDPRHFFTVVHDFKSSFVSEQPAPALPQGSSPALSRTSSLRAFAQFMTRSDAVRSHAPEAAAGQGRGTMSKSLSTGQPALLRTASKKILTGVRLAGVAGPAENQVNTQLLMQVVLNLANLSSPAKPFTQAKEWALRQQAERFAQGDAEVQLGMTTSHMCDRLRDRAAFSRYEEEHLTCVVIPAFQMLGGFLPAVKSQCLPPLRHSQSEWKKTMLAEAVRLSEK